MRNQRQNLRSTKKTKFELYPPVNEEAETNDITLEKAEEDEKVEYEIQQKVIEPQYFFQDVYETRQTMYTDHTGKFPHT